MESVVEGKEWNLTARTDGSVVRSVDARELLQMRGQHHANHGSVCTSTESTAGRSRTIGAQVSPASAEA